MDITTIDPKALESLSNEELAVLLAEVRSVSSLPVVPTPKQMEALTAPERGSDAVLFSGTLSSGKSSYLCMELIRECLDIPNNRALLARKENVVLKRTILPTLEGLIAKLPIASRVKHKLVDQKFIFPNGSELFYMGLGNEKDVEKLKGMELGILGIDEATELAKAVFEVAVSRVRHKPAADAGRLKVRLTCNPEPGWVKEDFVDIPKEGYRRIDSLPRDNPHTPAGYIEGLYKQYADNPAFIRAYLEGDWNAYTGHNQIIDGDKMNQAMLRTSVAEQPCAWGIDVGRWNDSTILFERRGLRFTELKEWKKMPLDKQATAVEEVYRIKQRQQERENERAKKEGRESEAILPQQINIDEIGLGTGLVDILRGRGLPVRGINVSRPSRDNPEIYFNSKAEIWWNFRKMFEDDIDIPNNPLLRAELGAMKYEYKNGRIKVEEKEVVRKRLGRSPDRADALVLASWHGNASYVSFEDDDDEELDDDPETQKEDTINSLVDYLKRGKFDW